MYIQKCSPILSHVLLISQAVEDYNISTSFSSPEAGTIELRQIDELLSHQATLSKHRDQSGTTIEDFCFLRWNMSDYGKQ